MTRTWRDVDEIAMDLVDQYPNKDPLSVKLPELKQLILGLPGFADGPDAVDDRMLETIQAAWYDEFED